MNILTLIWIINFSKLIFLLYLSKLIIRKLLNFYLFYDIILKAKYPNFLIKNISFCSFSKVNFYQNTFYVKKYQ